MVCRPRSGKEGENCIRVGVERSGQKSFKETDQFHGIGEPRFVR